MKVIFLSAGRGMRMMPYTADRPKPLLQIDTENTVLDIQLKKLQKTPIDEIVIVGGYFSDMIEQKVKKEYPDMDIKVIFNPFYDISNNFISLWLARHNMDEPFIIINGDDIFESSVVNGLIKETKGKEVTMVIDRKDSYDDDDMKVITNDKTVTQVSKKIPVEKANGESIGMIKFEGDGIKKLKKVIDELIKDPANRDVFWLKAIQELMIRHDNVSFYEVSRDQWEEIDFHEEYLQSKEKGERKYYFELERNEKLREIQKSRVVSNPFVRTVRKESRKIFRYLLRK